MKSLFGIYFLGLATACAGGAAGAETVEQFYKGKTLNLVISVIGGEGFSINGRIVATHMSRHLPGNPTVVPKHMPGAGHVLAANYLFTEAPRDGSTIGTIAPNIVLHQLLDG